ncbi:MAG: hypothetical protein QM764_22135 [Chitinophagaceae bacterium]
MTAAEFNTYIGNKNFRSTDGTHYRFIAENTLRVGNAMANSAKYRIDESGVKNHFILHHDNILGNEPVLIQIVSLQFPVTISMMTKLTGKFLGTWVEQSKL